MHDYMEEKLESLFRDPMGCEVCHEIWPRTKSATINSERFRCTFKALQASARLEGCPSCELLSRAARRFEELSKLRVEELQLHFAYPDEPTQWRRNGEMNACLSFKTGNGSWSEYYELISLRGSTSPWKSIPKRPVISYHIGSTDLIAWTVDQITECTGRHQDCPNSKAGILPTRILKIRANESREPGEVPFTVKLFNSNNNSGIYACLSHCWGNASFRTTTRNNVRDHENDIAWMTIPKTFQQAIWFTYQLGIRYLWIDSLCIVQDDMEEWRHEAGRMASIYANCFICLAASAAPNGITGILPDPSKDSYAETLDLMSITPPSFDPVIKPEAAWWRKEKYEHCGFRPTESICDTIYLRRAHEHWRYLWWPYCSAGILTGSNAEHMKHFKRSWKHSSSLIGSGTDLCPLLQRAWVYQERILSPRILHFGPRELLWECTAVSDCQCGALKNIYSDRDTLDISLKSMYFQHMYPTDPDYAEVEGLSLWHKLVSQYSALDLTFESDKLPAIAGLATQLHRLIKSDYLAGLWKETLSDEILWETVGPKRHRPKTWRAPSWSWASVEGIISYPNGWLHETDCSILRAHTTILGSNPFGPVSDGYLNLSAKLVEVQWFPKAELASPSERGDTNFFLTRKRHNENLNVSFDSIWPSTGNASSPASVVDVSEHKTLFCLLLGHDTATHRDEEGFNRESPPPLGLAYLVLQSIDATEEAYERVGIGYEHCVLDLFSGVETQLITLR